MNVAIVDSGLDLNSDYYKIIGNIDFIHKEGDITDFCGHGTAVTKYINRSVRGVSFFIVRLLDADNCCSSENLFYALKYLTKVDVKLIVLCVATVRNELVEKFQEVINELSKQKKIIISSLYNKKNISFPACLNNVIGVKGKQFKEDVWYYNKDKKIQCVTDSSFVLLRGNACRFSLLDGNSKATALFTIIILKMFENGGLDKNISFNELNIKLNDISDLKQNCMERKEYGLSSYKNEYSMFINCVKQALNQEFIDVKNPAWRYFDTMDDIENMERYIDKYININCNDLIYKRADFDSFEKLFTRIYFERD